MATIQVLRFASQRSGDLRALFGDDAVHGDVRRVLRRRARSHRRYTVRRFRRTSRDENGGGDERDESSDEGVFAEGLDGLREADGDGDGDGGCGSSLSRRSRRRSGTRLRSELASREERDSSVAVRSATSVWHAKRMVMVALWGVRIALHHNERGVKSVLRHVCARPRGTDDGRRLSAERRRRRRASKRSDGGAVWDPVRGPAVVPRSARPALPSAAVYDASHAHSRVELRGASRDAIVALLLCLVLPSARGAARRRLSTPSTAPQLMLRHTSGAVIAPARAMWAGASGEAAGCGTDACLLLWCHIAAVEALAAVLAELAAALAELQHSTTTATPVTVRCSRPMECATFDIVGRDADALVLDALRCSASQPPAFGGEGDLCGADAAGVFLFTVTF